MNTTSVQTSTARTLVTHSNGVLPIPASATQQRPTGSTKPSTKASASRLKIIIRGLPSNLLLNEFEAILGEEWKVNKGRVDWFNYKPGKSSKELVICCDFSKYLVTNLDNFIVLQNHQHHPVHIYISSKKSISVYYRIRSVVPHLPTSKADQRSRVRQDPRLLSFPLMGAFLMVEDVKTCAKEPLIKIKSLSAS